MNTFSTMVSLAHVMAGFSALIIFWVPVFTRKGGLNHRRVGKWYVKLMWTVVLTAIILSLKNVVVGRTQMAVFLGFLALLTAKPLWLGIAILDNKRSLSWAYRRSNITLSALVSVAGMALIAYGLSLGGKGNAILMFVFGGLGVSSLVDLWRAVYYELNQGASRGGDKTQWLKEHIFNMGVSGIAAHTAFLAFGANSLLPQSYAEQGGLGILAWISPTVLGVIAILWSVRKYRVQAPSS